MRERMWVNWITRNAVGVLHRFVNEVQSDVERPDLFLEPVAGAEVHLTGPDGHTVLIVPFIPLRDLRQATLNEIPEPRRPAPEVGARYGYH